MKLTAKDLRVGNIIHFNDVDGQVETKITWEDLKWASVNEKTFNEFHKPIPLTEEWLLRFGFKRFGKDFSLKGIIIHTRKRGYVLRKSVPIIKYVHQLMNLFYALTGEELQLNQTT
jgi:hypothetical protein